MLRLVFITLLIFISCCVLADEVKEPKVISINDYLMVYEDVAMRIIKNIEYTKVVNKNDKYVNIIINNGNPLFKEIVILYKKALDGNGNKRRFWVFDDSGNIGINFDRDKKIVTKIIAPAK